MLKKIGSVTLFKIVNALLGLGSSIYITRVFEKEDVSLFGIYLISVATLMILTKPGLNQVLLRKIISNRLESIFAVQKASLFFAFKTSLPILAALLLANYYKLVSSDHLFVGVVALCVTIISSFNKFQMILNSTEKFIQASLQEFSFSISFILLVLLSINFNLGIKGIIFFHLLTNLLMCAVGYLLFSKEHPNSLKNFSIPLSSKENTEANKLSIVSFFDILSSSFDRYILYYLNPISLANFHVGSQVPLKLKDYSKAPLSVPLIINFKKGKRVFKEKASKSIVLYLFVVVTVSSFLYLGADYYIPFVYGNRYIDTIPFARLMGLIFGLKMILFFYDSKEIAFNETSFYRKLFYIRKVVYILIIFFFIKDKQEIAIAYAFIFSDLSTILLYSTRSIGNHVKSKIKTGNIEQ